MKVGIIGAGKIANKMADTINKLEGISNYAIASRSYKRGNEFKTKYGFEIAYTNYEDLFNDPKVDLVYIATPHSFHYKQMLMALKHKKPVLCEKILTTSLKDSKDIYYQFKKNNILLVEALWTSFMPFNEILNNLLYEDEIIGEIKAMEANFDADIYDVPRVNQKLLGGGAAMDLGVYPISFILRTLGFNYKTVDINKAIFKNEVDVDDEIEIIYENNVKAIARFSVIKPGNRDVIILGTKGKICIDSVNCPESIKVYSNDDQLIKDIDVTPTYGGFEYQLFEIKKCLELGLNYSPSWDKDKSLMVAQIIEKIINYSKKSVL